MTFDTKFTHHNTVVNGIRLHYLMGGQGEPMVLLHGYPQTSYAWRKVMPELAKYYTLIVPDLRGLGDSERPETGYDKHTIAEDIYQLIRFLNFEQVNLVGHDYGGSTAYVLAAEHPEMIRCLVAIECSPAGLGETDSIPLVVGGGQWHRVFHLVPDLPEALVAGRENLYLGWFYQHYCQNPGAISDADIDEYIRTYSQPGAMRAGFELYRTYFQDTKRGQEYLKNKLKMPVLAIGADTVFGKFVEECMQRAAIQVKGAVINNCGHFVMEEKPEALIQHILTFMRNNDTSS